VSISGRANGGFINHLCLHGVALRGVKKMNGKRKRYDSDVTHHSFVSPWPEIECHATSLSYRLRLPFIFLTSLMTRKGVEIKLELKLNLLMLVYSEKHTTQTGTNCLFEMNNKLVNL
jgi:hypothetical protein